MTSVFPGVQWQQSLQILSLTDPHQAPATHKQHRPWGQRKEQKHPLPHRAREQQGERVYGHVAAGEWQDPHGGRTLLVSLPAAPTPPSLGRALVWLGTQPGSPCPGVQFAHRPRIQATEKGVGWQGDNVLPGLCPPGEKPEGSTQKGVLSVIASTKHCFTIHQQQQCGEQADEEGETSLCPSQLFSNPGLWTRGSIPSEIIRNAGS